MGLHAGTALRSSRKLAATPAENQCRNEGATAADNFSCSGSFNLFLKEIRRILVGKVSANFSAAFSASGPRETCLIRQPPALKRLDVRLRVQRAYVWAAEPPRGAQMVSVVVLGRVVSGVHPKRLAGSHGTVVMRRTLHLRTADVISSGGREPGWRKRAMSHRSCDPYCDKLRDRTHAPHDQLTASCCTGTAATSSGCPRSG